MKLRGLLIVAALSAVPCVGSTGQQAAESPARGYQAWPSQPPKGCPFEPSKDLTGIVFTGVYSDYHCGDTWYPSWASDGNQYSPWTDGKTAGVRCGSGGANAHTANAVLIGDDPLSLQIKNTSPPQPASPRPYEGRYPCGSLIYNGIWYYGTYCLGPAGRVKHDGMTWNWPVLGPMPGFRISKDHGKTWIPSPLSPEKPLFPEPKKFMGPVKMGCPHFVDFGRNMEHSPDGKAYLVGMGAEENDPKPRYANLSWITADQVYLARVKPSIQNINDISKYEFFAGHDATGKPIWTNDFSRIRPLLDWNNNMGCVTVTYDAPLKKFLMCVTDGWPTVAKMNSYILEADTITGPWRLVAYMKDFGEQGYFLNFPSKFIGKDGRTLWLCYSANFSSGWNGIKLHFNPPGGRYGLCLHKVRLLTAEEKAAVFPSPSKSPSKIVHKVKAVFPPSLHSPEKAPDGTATASRPYRVKVPGALLQERGTMAMWFKPGRTLRGRGDALELIRSEALQARIEPRRDSVRIMTRFGAAMTGSPPSGEKAQSRPYSFRTLLTHLEGGRWYFAAWTWDCSDAARNGFFLDGISQGEPPPYEYPGQLKPAPKTQEITVGDVGLTVGPLRVFGDALSGGELVDICRAAGHKPYLDEGVRFSGEKFIPTDVDLDHPIYETSFDDPSVLKDWRLEGGRRMSVVNGNLVLESDAKSMRSETNANHLVCWLTREVPADFLLEFSVRPQNRRQGLNIVFFNARGLHGENIFRPPIQPRNGLFRLYHSGDINNYHVSYWSGGRGTANLRKNKGFYLAAIGKDLVWTAPPDSFQTIRVYKRGGMIRLMVDDVVALSYDDDGKTYGPVHTHSGWIGLRQMAHTHRCEYGWLKVYPLKPRAGE